MGRSSDAEVAELEEHLLVCAECRQRLSRTDLYVSSMSEAAAGLSSHRGFVEYGNWQLLKLLAVAGSTIGLILLGMLAAQYY